MIKYNFKDKLVLVTASSKGIGFELAKQFALNNAEVALCSRNEKNIKLAKRTLEKIDVKKNVKFFKIDLSEVKNLKKFIKKVSKSFNKKIDILINNSGGPDAKLLEDITQQDWDFAINNNLKSFIEMSMLVIKDMKKKNWGRIINLTSSTAKEPAVKMGLSNVTRAGVLAFSKTLSKEIGQKGITVNTILTGSVLTDRLINLIKKNNKSNLKKALKKITSEIPVKYIALPNDFVQLILFLCSEEAGYVNGTAISVDGGTSKTIF